MNEKLLEIHEFKGIGYKPLIDFGSWRVAILRYIDELIPDRIERVERHIETDEVFVLLAGRAILFIGDGDPELTELTALVLEPEKFYNVKRCTWHNIVLSTDASILLVENRNTGQENSDFTALNYSFRRIIVETAAREQPDCWGHLI